MTRTDACHCLLYFLLSKLSLRAQVVMRNLFVAVLVVVVTHERSESWPLTNTIQDMTEFLLKILEAIVVLAHCRKLDWIEAFPPPSPLCLCSWRPTKCLQLSVECTLFAQYMWLGCTFSWLRPYCGDSTPWLISVDSLSTRPQRVLHRKVGELFYKWLISSS